MIGWICAGLLWHIDRLRRTGVRVLGVVLGRHDDEVEQEILIDVRDMCGVFHKSK